VRPTPAVPARTSVPATAKFVAWIQPRGPSASELTGWRRGPVSLADGTLGEECRDEDRSGRQAAAKQTAGPPSRSAVRAGGSHEPRVTSPAAAAESQRGADPRRPEIAPSRAADPGRVARSAPRTSAPPRIRLHADVSAETLLANARGHCKTRFRGNAYRPGSGHWRDGEHLAARDIFRLRRGSGRLSCPHEARCRDDDAGDHPGVLTAVQMTRPRGERPGAFVVGRSPCQASNLGRA
jgi:hypothetical protein